MKFLWLFFAVVLLLAAWRLGSVLGRAGRVLAGLLGVLLGLIGVGVIPLPDIERLIGEIGNRLGDWTYLLVGANAFLETGAFLGFLAPGETMVLFGGVLAGEGTIELWPLIAVVWASAMLGDVTSYWLGHRYGRGFLLRFGPRVRVGERQVAFVEKFFRRHGLKTVFFGRWVGVLRPLVPFFAGSTRLPFWRFLPIDLLATGIWSIALCALGAAFWHNFDELANIVGQAIFAIGTVIVLTALAATAVSLRRSQRRSAEIEGWIEQQAADDHMLVSRLTGSLWSLITRIEPAFPGHRRARHGAAGSGSVADPPSGSAPTE